MTNGDASTSIILINDLVAGNPLHMNPNDSSSTTLILFKLPGSKIIESGDVLFGQWDRCNVVVFTWIMNCVSHDVYMGLVYHADAASVWKELGETYDKSARSALLTRDPLPEEATTSHSSSSFTAEQKKLLNLINKIPSGSIHANMAEANQNLTVSTIGMFNILDISNSSSFTAEQKKLLNLINKIPSGSIHANVVVYDFLVEPGYCMNTLMFRGNQRQEFNHCFSLFLMIMWLISNYMDDARIYGMQSKLELVKAEGIAQRVALTLKTKGGLELLSFDDLYYKLKTLEVDIKGYSTFSSSQSAGPSHSAFVSTTSASKKMSYADSPSYSSSTYTAPSNSKTGSHRSGNVIEDVLQSFVADTEPEQQLAYEDFEQIEKMDLEEMDLKWQMAMLSVRVHKFEHKVGRKINFDKKESARFNKKKVRCYKCLKRGHFARECRAKGGNDKQRYSSFKIQEIGKKEEDSKALITVRYLIDWTVHYIQTLITGLIRRKPVTKVMLENLLLIESLLSDKSSEENPYSDAEDEGIFDSGCSRSMTGNMERLDDFQEFQRGKELQQFNLFSISQICDKKNRVLFTDTDCLVLSKDFKLPDESMVVLRVPRKHNLYTINLNNLSPRGNLACLVAKASVDESVKWHRRMGHAYRVYNVPNKRVEETMNLRYLEEKPNVQGLGHEWYFDLDYLNDTLGYKRDKANQSAGTQEASTNPVGTQDADSDSECDEQVIIVPSYPSHNIQEAEPKDTSGDEVDDSPLDTAEENFQQELARLKGQVQRATSDAKDAEELQKRASTKTVPTGSIPVPSGDTTISPGDVPVPTGSPTDSFFHDEPTKRFPSPSDLRNNEPSPGIFSSSSYDDEFCNTPKNHIQRSGIPHGVLLHNTQR
ncbi:ribonuclease H-like domain-containing protein [Tanacetum coccineum]